jgi:chemosensory pili system protein ChpA (sensor histidine kinase/response regulator)
MKRILVIDDDPPVARIVKAALDIVKVEHTLDYCSDGGQGRAKAAQGGYDLICLDLSMPFMDGFEALGEMKRNPKSAQIPVVVITGAQEPEMRQRVMELGAAAVFAKPFEPVHLGHLLQRVLAGEQVQPPPSASPGARLRPLGT